MNKSIEDLYKSSVFNDRLTTSVIHDYFNISNREHIDTIWSVYSGMFKCMEMNKSIVEKAYKNNQLDKLIHDSYKSYGGIAKSGYYRKFCEENIVIGDTYYDLRETPKIKTKTK